MKHVLRLTVVWGGVGLFLPACPAAGHGVPSALQEQMSRVPEAEESRPDSVDERSLEAWAVEGRRPTVDGRLVEAAWRQAPPATDFVQFEPSAGSPAGERTEVRVLFKGDAVYIGARLFDSAPGRIRAPLARRDTEVESDWFVVYLDPNRTGATAFAFGVNPRGVKRDFLIGEDGTEQPAWRAVWDAAVDADSLGWTVEMRIPLSQLRFRGGPGGDGDGSGWGVNFRRQVSRTGEISSWAPIPRNRRQMVASFGELRGLDGLRPPMRIELLPYSMARATHAPAAPDGSRPLFATVGADLNASLGSHLTFAGTFNPDFGQVEADPAVVNVSGYRTFFPERRPFFLEDEELFTHDVDRTRIFHSRRIGRDVQATANTRSSQPGVPDASGILAASKVSGRTPGGWSMGLLHAVTNAEVLVSEDSVGVETFEPVAPRTNYVVARVAREPRDGLGSFGGIVTLTDRSLSGDLQAELPSRSLVGGGSWQRRSGEYHASASLLGSRVEGSPEVIASLQTLHGRYLQRPDAGHFRFDPARTRLEGFAADADLSWTGEGNWSWAIGGHALSPAFEANDLGYQREADVAQQYTYVDYNRLERSFLRRRRLILTQWAGWTFGGERVSTGGRADLQLQLQNFWGMVLQAERHMPALSTDHLRGGPALWLPGSARRRLVLYTDRRRALHLRLDGSLTREDQTGGQLRVARATLGIEPAGKWRLTVEPSLVERVGSVEYLTTRTVAESRHAIFGRMDQRTLSVVTRMDLALTPTASVQLYAQPYVVTREVEGFMEVRDPRARTLAGRFHGYTAEQLHYDAERERIYVDRTGDGRHDFSLPDYAFTYGQLSSNLVFRWEFRPGSTLFVVWSHDFSERSRSRDVRPFDGLGNLVGLGGSGAAPSTNTLLLKLSYWLSP